MAFKKKRFRKRTFKRRSFKRRTFRKKFKKTQYDGIYYSKCMTNVSLHSGGSATTNNFFSIGWGNSGTSGSNSAFIDDDDEF